MKQNNGSIWDNPNEFIQNFTIGLDFIEKRIIDKNKNHMGIELSIDRLKHNDIGQYDFKIDWQSKGSSLILLSTIENLIINLDKIYYEFIQMHKRIGLTQ